MKFTSRLGTISFHMRKVHRIKITPESVVAIKEDVPFKEFGKEGIVLNLINGDYFELDEVGLFIWKSLNGKHNLKRVAKRIGMSFEVNEKLALKDLIFFVKDLYKKNLVRIV